MKQDAYGMNFKAGLVISIPVEMVAAEQNKAGVIKAKTQDCRNLEKSESFPAYALRLMV